ncbi:hypothetical protein FA95DRAFT_1583773 [Auriscalpium vulgare]|uniref:Uncharacterized protein n=1 Tax=Auriscalpium vulgare TaxID=40419 RepID=A0ACB8RKB3_9AGAM|nr:hypothetical protein FA95DRAFT_1583773 [Auriscalpium vulgare]
MSSAARKQAPRPARPVGRYWKGKAPKGAPEAVSDDEDEDEEMPLVEEEGDVALSGEQEFLGAGEEDEDDEQPARAAPKAAKMSVTLRDVNISKDGKVIVAGKEEVGRTEFEEESSEEEEEGKPQGQDSESEEESSEEESESEEEKPKLHFRPVFVPKRGRITVDEVQAEDTEEILRKKEEEAEERRRQSHNMVADSIRRELAEKEKEAEEPDVDDTDGLEPAEEFDAWRLRELARIKRDKEVELERELEREEVERRRALPEEQRLKEDLERANKLRDEKPKGKQVFLQKYWHKGAFHQDEEILKRHDFTEATESTVDVSVLPEVMQVKNFGKRGRTKYTHLLDQDTTAKAGGFGAAALGKGGKSGEGSGCFLCGGPHLKRGIIKFSSCPLSLPHMHCARLDCPSNTGGAPGGRPGTGANAAPTGVRDEQKGSWRDRDDGYAPARRGGFDRDGPRADSREQRDGRGQRAYSPRRDDRERDRFGGRGRESRSRERSPRRDRARDDGDQHWRDRRRSRSRDGRYDRDEKRRRSMNAPAASRRRVVKVAVIGSGLAGLTAAYLLSNIQTRPDAKFPEDEDIQFEVHIFEKAESLGMDSHSVSLSLPGETEEWRVDVPMRSFQGGYYPQLIALYKRLGVSFRRADFSYSFSYLTSLPASDASISPKAPISSALSLKPTLIYDGASGRSGISIPTTLTAAYAALAPNSLERISARLTVIVTFAVSMLLLGYNFLRLQLLAAPLLRGKAARELTWAEWAEQATPRGLLARLLGLDEQWRAFVADVCAPLFSAVCTAAREDVDAHPAEEFLDFIWLTFLTHHYVVTNGVRDVVARLTTSLPPSQIHLGAATTSIIPDKSQPGLVSVVCSPSDAGSQAYHGFAHVIFATQANHAAPLVQGYAKALAESSIELERKTAASRADQLAACLSQFEYRQTIVINHTDSSFLPEDHRDRRDLNLVTVASASEPQNPPEKDSPGDANPLVVAPSYAMTTHMLPRPAAYAKSSVAIYQTTNPIVPPSAGSVLSVARLERALLTRAGKLSVDFLCAKEGVGALQGAARRESKDAAGMWVVGAYAYRGIPLLEGCVAGARDVVEKGLLACEGVSVGSAPW